MAEASPLYTEDGFLDGKVRIRQPAKGFRAGSDAVLLAASVSLEEGGSLLDIGCGVGTAALCARYRFPNSHIYGVEFQEELVSLARENCALNDFLSSGHHHLQILKADITRKEDFEDAKGPAGRRFLEEGFDHVISNPPFYEEGRAQCSPSNVKTQAHIEGDARLDSWVRFCAARVRPRGTLTLIHRSDRLPEILFEMGRNCGGLTIIPLWPNRETPAKRVLVQGTKSGNGPSRLLPGIVLHELDGKPTTQSEKILREGAGLMESFN